MQGCCVTLFFLIVCSVHWPMRLPKKLRGKAVVFSLIRIQHHTEGQSIYFTSMEAINLIYHLVPIKAMARLITSLNTLPSSTIGLRLV